MLISIVLPVSILCATSSVAANLSPANLDGLKSQFQASLKSLSDIASVHYTVAGLKELGGQVDDNVCSSIKKLVEKNNIESIYHATEAAKAISNCKLSVDDFRSTIQSTLQSDKSKTADIYYAVASSVNLGLPVDESAVEKRLNALAKTDDSIASQGYALLTGAKLSQPVAKFYASTINDLVQQADEIDGRILQYEGGVGVTAMVFNAFYEVAQRAGESVKIDAKQLLKFAAYFSSKKHVATLRSAYYLSKVFKYLSDSKNSVPVVVSRISSSAVNAQNPSVLVSVTNFLGQPVGEMTVTAESAKRNDDGVIALSKQKLTQRSSDATLYELPFYSNKIPKGFYTIQLSLKPVGEGKFIGLTDNTIEVKVTSEGNVENGELVVADRDTSVQGKTYKLNFPNALSDKLELDYHQKLTVKFQLKDKKSDEYLRVQQAFLRFTNKKSNKEVIYLAEAAGGVNTQYKVEVDLTTNANDFRSQSGAYELSLIVGDSLLQNPFEWKLNDNVQLSFHEDSVADKDFQDLYSPQPEIIHQFRKDEDRPPSIVSLVFSGLTLLPLLILLVSVR